MTKDDFSKNIHRHFVVWFFALFVFAFLEWRHTGFISYVFPFPVLVFFPAFILAGEYLVSFSLKK